MLRLGVLVIILAIAIDPFSQQMVRQESKSWYVNEYNGTKATTNRIAAYTLGHVYDVNKTKSADENAEFDVISVAGKPHESMQAAILNALSLPKDAILQHANLQCPHGNCTWPEVETLGVCHRCNDLSEELRRVDNFSAFFGALHADRVRSSMSKSDEEYVKEVQDEIEAGKYTAWTLPNGHFLANFNNCSTEHPNADFCPDFPSWIGAPNFKMTSFGTGNPNKTNSMGDIDTLIWSSSVIHVNQPEQDRLQEEWEDSTEDWGARGENSWLNWPEAPMSATECALYYCVKAIKSTFEGNVIREEAHEITAARVPGSFNIDNDFDGYPPESTPDEDMRDSLEFHPQYSLFEVSDLEIQYPSDKNSEEMYTVGQRAVKSISAFFQDTLKADHEVTKNMRDAARELLDMPDAVMYNGVVKGWDEPTPFAIGGLYAGSTAHVNETFEKLATALTNDIRNSGSPGVYSRTTTTTIEGQISIVAAVWLVSWYWIALHGVVFVGGCSFIVATIIATSNTTESVPHWKNSALAAMSQGPTMGQVLEGVNTSEEMRSLANVEAVTMQKGDSNDEAFDMPERRRTGGTDGEQSSVGQDVSRPNSQSTLCDGNRERV